VFLPFDDDLSLSIILSKASLLAKDDRIKIPRSQGRSRQARDGTRANKPHRPVGAYS